MQLQLTIAKDLSAEQARALHKTHDDICVRQVAFGNDSLRVRRLRLRFGTDPMNDAATLASCLWGRKRQATTLYLFVSRQDIEALHNLHYLAALQKAFSRCTRHSHHPVFRLVLVAKDSPTT